MRVVNAELARAVTVFPDEAAEVLPAEIWEPVMESIRADRQAMCGELPGAGELARRAALGACDALSTFTARIAARLWRQSDRRGFSGCIKRWRAAAIMALRWWSAWLEYVLGWPVRQSAEINVVFAAPAGLAYVPPLRSGPGMITRCYPRTGPPLGVRCRGVQHALGRSGP
jgi:hypothetical protein